MLGDSEDKEEENEGECEEEENEEEEGGRKKKKVVTKWRNDLRKFVSMCLFLLCELVNLCVFTF